MAANTIVMRNPPLDSNKWYVDYTSTDVSGCEELLAAVSGKSHYLEKIIIDCASAITISIGGGETTSALTSTFLGAIPFAATTGQKVYEFPDEALVIGESVALCIDASGAGNVHIWAEGLTGPVFP